MTGKDRKEARGRGSTSYDRLIKAALRRFQPDLAAFLLGERPSEVRELDPALAAAAGRFADKILDVAFAGRPGVLLHVEFQIEGGPEMPERMLEYVALLARTLGAREHRGKEFVAAVVYLDRTTYRGDPGMIELAGRGRSRLLFAYDVVKLWELDPRSILAMKSPGLCPFVPLMSGNPVELVLRSQEKIARTPESLISAEGKGELLGILAGLAGRVVHDPKLVERLVSEIRAMDEKNLVFKILREEGEAVGFEQGKREGKREGKKEGKKEGEQKGRQEGILAEARRAVERVLARRFGSLPEGITGALEGIDDRERLEGLLEEAAVCAALDRFLARLAGA